MAETGDVLRVQVFGADPAHAEREARELRDALNGLAGVEARFADRRRRGVGPAGSKGTALTPEVILLVTGSTSAVVRAAVKGWVEVRKSRYARVEFSDGTVAELRGGVSGAELKELRDGSRPQEEPDEVNP